MTPLVSPNTPRLAGRHALEWQDQGLCRTYDPLYWDDDQNENSHAATICGSCPVLEQCRDWALNDGYRDTVHATILAGMTPAARRQTRKAMGMPMRPCKLCGNELPEGSGLLARYHKACSTAVRRARHRGYKGIQIPEEHKG